MPKHTSIPKELAAQRYPEAPWLAVVRWRRQRGQPKSGWQLYETPGPLWLAYDVRLVTEVKFRAIWEAAGPWGLSVWLGLMGEVSKQGLYGLIWGDPAMLAEMVPHLGQTGLDWLVEAGWVVYLTTEQAKIVRAGGTVADVVEVLAKAQDHPEKDQGGGDSGDSPAAEPQDVREVGCAAYLAANPQAPATVIGEYLGCSARTIRRLRAWRNRSNTTATEQPSGGHAVTQTGGQTTLMASQNVHVEGPVNPPDRCFSSENRGGHESGQTDTTLHYTTLNDRTLNGKTLNDNTERRTAPAPENKARAHLPDSESGGGCQKQPPGGPGPAESVNLTQSDHRQAERASSPSRGRTAASRPARSARSRAGDAQQLGDCLSPSMMVWADREAVEFGRRCHEVIYGERPPEHEAIRDAPRRFAESVGAWASQWHNQWGPLFNGSGPTVMEAVYVKLQKKRKWILEAGNPGGRAMKHIQNMLSTLKAGTDAKRAGKGVGLPT